MEDTCSVELLEYIRKMVMGMIQQKHEAKVCTVSTILLYMQRIQSNYTIHVNCIHYSDIIIPISSYSITLGVQQILPQTVGIHITRFSSEVYWKAVRIKFILIPYLKLKLSK